MQNFKLDPLSFFLGIVGAYALWGIVKFIRKIFPGVKNGVGQYFTSRSDQSRSSLEYQWCKQVDHLVQKNHLTSDLFSFDEIILEPKILLPLPVPNPDAPPPPDRAIPLVIPYLPDWPEFTSEIGYPSIRLAEAFSTGANLILIGRQGSGKTTALSHLARTIARRAAPYSPINEFLPIFLQVNDLAFGAEPAKDPLEPLILSVTNTFSVPASLKKLIAERLSEGKVLLILDGCDEYSPAANQVVCSWLAELKQKYPGLRLILSAPAENLGAFTPLGLIPVTLAAWSANDRQEYLNRWATSWSLRIQTKENILSGYEIGALKSWILAEANQLSPLEFSLRCWGAFIGMLNSTAPSAGLKAYLIKNLNPNHLPAFQQAATRMLQNRQPFFVLNSSERLSGWGAQILNSNFLVEHPQGKISFVHPYIASFFLSSVLETSNQEASLEDLSWSVLAQAYHFLAEKELKGDWIIQLLDASTPPLYTTTTLLSRWLPDAPATAVWRNQLMKRLVTLISNEALPLGLRARFVGALISTQDPSLFSVFHQWIVSRSPAIRQLACLAMGVLRDTRAFDDLTHLLEDPIQPVQEAACISLACYDKDLSLKPLVNCLTQGGENLRRLAAEILSNNPDDGYEILKEAATVDDILTRRASVFGLFLIKQDWAKDLLLKISVEDGQWVVRSAAAQALEYFSNPDPATPTPLPALASTQWIEKLAKKHNLEITPDQPMDQLLLLALRSENAEEHLCALHYLKHFTEEGQIRAIYDDFFRADGNVRETALQSIWYLQVNNIPCPPPTQYGFS